MVIISIVPSHSLFKYVFFLPEYFSDLYHNYIGSYPYERRVCHLPATNREISSYKLEEVHIVHIPLPLTCGIGISSVIMQSGRLPVADRLKWHSVWSDIAY
jgi:hypothetical protein